MLLLSPGGPGLPPVWVTAGLVLPAFCALLIRRRLPLVYTGWAVALAGLALALADSRVRVTGPGGTTVSAWPGVADRLRRRRPAAGRRARVESAVLASAPCAPPALDEPPGAAGPRPPRLPARDDIQSGDEPLSGGGVRPATRAGPMTASAR